MEDYVIIILSIGLMVCTLIGIRMFRTETSPKRAKKEVQDSAQKEVIASKDLTITSMQKELRRINGKLARTLQLEPELEEELTESGGKAVTWEEIQALVGTHAPKYAKIVSLGKKQIMEAVEGMTMEEVLQYVKQFTGNQQSQGPITPDAAGYNPNWA